MRTVARLVRVVPLVLLALSPFPAGSSVAGSRPPETVRIGILAPLSGPFASGGSAFLQAVRLAADRANAEGGLLGRKIELVTADTQGRVEIARSETLRLLSREKVFALVGAYLSEETVGVIEAAAPFRAVVVVPVAATAEITDRVAREYDRYRNVFRVGYSIPQWAKMMADFLAEREVRRYAFVGASIRWNRELAGALSEALAPRAIRPVYEAFYSPGNPAFEPVILAAIEHRPEILVLGDPGGNAVTFVKKLREGRAPFPVLSVGGALGDARVARTLPLSPPLYVQAAAWTGSTPEATRYVERFARRYGYAPVGYSDTLPYDAASILFAAIREAGALDTDRVVKALESGTFPGAAGRYRFDRTHQAAWGTPDLSGVVIRWEPEGSRILFPAR
ncbi:MAG: ABC transporter substrate-binding protein [Deltaproteobacteria bacterium]